MRQPPLQRRLNWWRGFEAAERTEARGVEGPGRERITISACRMEKVRGGGLEKHRRFGVGWVGEKTERRLREAGRMTRFGILGAVLAVLWLWPAPAMAGAEAEADGIWLDILGCKIWVKDKQATIDTQWEGTCRLGKATAIGSFTRKFKDDQSRIVVETYTGRWIEGRQQGQGRYQNSLGVLYDGGFKDGLPDGKGVYHWADGTQYSGGWKAGLRVGRGTYRWANGATYEGDWIADRRSGWGVYLGTKGDSYEGGFLDGEYDGRGIINWSEGPRYEGEFKSGRPDGRGVLYIATGDEVHGDFRGSKLLGAGRCWRANSDRWFDCAQEGAQIENVK